jgi:hypothetical protein
MNTLGKSAENRKLPNSYNNSKAKKDRKLGRKKESRFEDWLKRVRWFPDKDFDRTKGWNEMDYVDKENEIYIELKGRRVNKYDYETTMIGHNKYIKARKLMLQGKKVYFFFSFRDRLCFYKVPMLLPAAVEIRDGGTHLRGCSEIKKHLFIPVGMLYDVEDFVDVNRFERYLIDRDYEETKLKEMIKTQRSLVNVKC